MRAKACIASRSEIDTRLLTAACRKFDIEIMLVETAGRFLSEFGNTGAEILFIDESIIGGNADVLVDEIKGRKEFEECFVIFTANSTERAILAQKIGADAFLPIPFSAVKFESIVRHVINLPRKVLLVGKAPENVQALKDKLLTIGFDVHFADAGNTCMKTIHTIFPDLVITEYNLFDMKGTELCRRIKNANLAGHIPVFILFRGNSSDVIEECFETGAHDVLLFPYESLSNIDRITTIITPPKRGKRERVLVIDDSPMVRNLIIKMFKQLGFLVSSAENGLEGYKIAKHIKPDLITCDYDMPVMNGWDFCLEVKQDEEIESPIIMISARGTDVDKKKGAVLGVVDYLTKPFKEHELREIVARVLSENKRRKERAAITKYIASDVLTNVDDIIEGIKKHEPEEKTITVLFSDICSFTPKCERLDARAIVRLLNSYFELMIRILQKNNAIIDKFIGDAIVARYDSGDTRKDSLDAARTALEMISALEQFNRESPEPIEIRIGINTGSVILGDIGCASFRLDYTMIGDNVNIGQRLESQAPHMGCLIAGSTLELLGDRVEAGPEQELELKGKKRKVKAYRLLRIKQSPAVK